MGFDDRWRVLASHKPHIPEFLKPQNLLSNGLQSIDIPLHGRRNIGDRQEGQRNELVTVIVGQPAQEDGPKVMPTCKDSIQALMLENLRDVARDLLHGISRRIGRLIGAPVSEEVRDQNAISLGGEVADLPAPVPAA